MSDRVNRGHTYWALAVHEAAHVVMGVMFGRIAIQVSLAPDKWFASTSLDAGFRPEQWRKDLLVTLAGEAAQKRADPSGRTLQDENGRSRAADDYEKAWKTAGRFNYQGDILEIRRVAIDRMAEGERVARDLVGELWPQIEALADEILMAGGTLERDALDRILLQEFPVDRRNALHSSCEFANRSPIGR